MKNNKHTSWTKKVGHKAGVAVVACTTMLNSPGCRIAPPETPRLISPLVEKSYTVRNEQVWDELNDAVNPAADEMANLFYKVNPLDKIALVMNFKKINAEVYPGNGNQGSVMTLSLDGGEAVSMPEMAHLMDKIMDTMTLYFEMKMMGLDPKAPDLDQVAMKMAKRLHNLPIPSSTDEAKKRFIKTLIDDALEKTFTFSYGPYPAYVQERINAAFCATIEKYKHRKFGIYGPYTSSDGSPQCLKLYCDFTADPADPVNRIAIPLADRKTITDLLNRKDSTPTEQTMLKRCIECLNERQQNANANWLAFDTYTKPNVHVKIYNPQFSIAARPVAAQQLPPDLFKVDLSSAARNR